LNSRGQINAQLEHTGGIAMHLGVMIGIIGGGLGVLGGVMGTYFSIKNTAGPRERAFMIRVAIVTWILVTAFVCGLLALPIPFNFLLWVPYLIALPLAILWSNRQQKKIRAEESESQE
jgi:hypothetical protein